VAIPVILLLAAAVAMGLVNGQLYLRDRRKPVLIGIHFLLAAGSLEAFAVLLHGTQDGAAPPGARLVTVAAGLVAVALLAAVTASLLGRRRSQTAKILLAAHATAGLSGLVLLLAWISG
jgi:hypothetical protein